jgi:glutaredoxin-like protein
MGMLKEKDRKKLIEMFKKIEKDVKIVMFTQEMECPHCEMTRTMLEEVSGLSDKLSLEVHDFVADADLAKNYGVDKIPATVLFGDRDYGVRFYGVPAGYEFNVLIEDIMDVGRRDPGLGKEVMAELAKVDRPVHLQVLISPT